MVGIYDYMKEFSYDRLMDGALGPSPLPSNYKVDLHISDGEITFRDLVNRNYDMNNHYTKGDGWKIHLSIDPEDLGRAWDKVIAPILMDANVGAAKFADGRVLENFADPRSSQAGKMVTIYGAGDESWGEIAKKLEIGLAEEGIRPGPEEIRGDRMVKGSQYIGYRNEKAFGNLAPYGDNGYLAASEIRRLVRDGVVEQGWEHNPTKQPDTLQDIDFSRDPEVLAARSAGRVAPVVERRPVQQQQQVPALETDIDRMLLENRAEYMETNKGSVAVFRGNPSELQGLQRQFQQRGIETSMEGRGSSFGEGLRIKSADMPKFTAMMDQHHTNQIARPAQQAHVQQQQQSPALEENIDRMLLENRAEYMGTNKGSVAMFRGNPLELEALQQQLQQRGIETSMEKTGSQFGEGLRVKSADMPKFTAMMDQHHTNQNVRPAQQAPAAPAAPSIEENVENFISQDRVRYVGTNKFTGVGTNGNDVAILRGSQSEMQTMQAQFRERGIESVIEPHGSQFGQGLRIKSADMGKFNAMMDQHYAQQTPALEANIDRMLLENRAEYMGTNKGSVAMFRGSPSELQALQQQFQQRGIETSMEGPDSGFGEGLRIKSADMPKFNGMMDQHHSNQRANPVQEPQRQHVPSDEYRAQQAQWQQEQADRQAQRSAPAVETPASSTPVAAPPSVPQPPQAGTQSVATSAPTAQVSGGTSSQQQPLQMGQTDGNAHLTQGNLALQAEPIAAPAQIPTPANANAPSGVPTPVNNNTPQAPAMTSSASASVSNGASTLPTPANDVGAPKIALAAVGGELVGAAASAIHQTQEHTTTLPTPEIAAPPPEPHVSTVPESSPHLSGKAGAVLGLAMAAHSMLDGSKSTGEKSDTLTQAGQAANVGTAGAGVVQSGASLASSLAAEGSALSGSLGTVEAVAGRAGVVGAVVTGGAVALHGIATGNTTEIAAGTGGTAGALAVAGAGAEAGAAVGAEVGAAVGVWFGGVGAAPGAAIGAAVGGVAGGVAAAWAGNKVGTEIATSVADGVSSAKDWIIGNSNAVRDELAAKGITQDQIKTVEESLHKDGKLTAQDARDYLEAKGVAAAAVNKLSAIDLGDKLASLLSSEQMASARAACSKATQCETPSAPIPSAGQQRSNSGPVVS